MNLNSKTRHLLLASMLAAVSLVSVGCSGKKKTVDNEMENMFTTASTAGEQQTAAAFSSNAPADQQDADTDQTAAGNDETGAQTGEDNTSAEKSPYNPDTGVKPFEKETAENVWARLEEVYNTAHEDELNSADAFAYEYVQSKIDSEAQERFDSYMDIVGNMENQYQLLNEYDPNLKNVLSDEAAYRLGGDSPLSQYAAGTAAGYFFDTGEVGQALREGAAIGAYLLYQWAMSGDNIAADATVVVAANDQYALIRNYGNFYELYSLLKDNAGFELALEGLEARRSYMSGDNALHLYWYTTESVFTDEYNNCTTQEQVDTCIENWSDKMNRLARTKVLVDKINEWEASEKAFDDAFLESLGLDSDTVIAKYNANQQSSSDDDDDDYDYTYEGRVRQIKSDYGPDEEYLKSFTVESGSYETKEEADAAKEAYIAEREDEVEEELRNLFQDCYREVTYSTYIYTVIDNQNNPLYSFMLPDKSPNAAFSEDGLCSLSNKDYIAYEDSAHTLLDQKGNILYSNARSEVNGKAVLNTNPASNGNRLQKTYDENFDKGSFEVLSLIDADGNASVLFEAKTIELEAYNYYFGDYYRYTCTGFDDHKTTGYVDMKSGKLLTEEEYSNLSLSDNNEYAGIRSSDGNAEDSDFTDYGEWIDAAHTYIYYKNGIYDAEGRLLKEVTEGQGINQISYSRGYFYIISKTEYYYALDTEFNRTMEPLNLKQEKYYSYSLLPVGLQINVDSSQSQSGHEYEYYDAFGNLFHAGDKGIRNDNIAGFTFNIPGEICRNLENGEEIVFSIAEGGIGTSMI
ncbi:MAG: hypothetical protein Q4B09_10825 [Lachnospiraceae bacterium]|nr:hypothetical protein [Lachnospiraceae bacterium]